MKRVLFVFTIVLFSACKGTTNNAANDHTLKNRIAFDQLRCLTN